MKITTFLFIIILTFVFANCGSSSSSGELGGTETGSTDAGDGNFDANDLGTRAASVASALVPTVVTGSSDASVSRGILALVDGTEAEWDIYTNETYAEARQRLDQAIQEVAAAGLVGEEILGTKFSLAVETRPAPTPYVAGEDTAVLESLEGKPPLPRQKPPYPVTVGLFGKPTLVNNVETLANLPPIILNGAAWYRGFGTAESPGTMLFSMNEEWQRPGVYELPYGAREGELLEELAGGLKDGARLRGILPGGPSSAFLLPDPDRPLSPEAVKAAGSNIGCGVMRGYAEGTCMVEATLAIARFFEKESCGQCPACRMETAMLANTLDRARQGQVGRQALDQIPRILEFNKGKGFCSLIGMPGPPLLSAIRLFPEDFDAHLKTGSCWTKSPES
jgi:NADH-quinone oxidoreductase subunit F